MTKIKRTGTSSGGHKGKVGASMTKGKAKGPPSSIKKSGK